MTTKDDDLIVCPFNLLPAEKVPDPTPEKIEAQKQFIRDRITDRDNSELVQDKEAVKLLAEMGSDLMINAFACNFKVDGKVNEDIVSPSKWPLLLLIYLDRSKLPEQSDIQQIVHY